MSHLENISFEMGLVIYMLWTNKCQEKILKILPLSSQEPFVFTVSCRLRDGERLLVWLLEVNLSVHRKRAPFLHSNEQQAVMLVCQHPDLGNLGS